MPNSARPATVGCRLLFLRRPPYGGDGNHNDPTTQLPAPATLHRRPATPTVPTSPTFRRRRPTGDAAASPQSVNTTGDASSPYLEHARVCTSGLAVTYVGAGTCTADRQRGRGDQLRGAIGQPQTFKVARRRPPTAPTITNLPASGTYGEASLPLSAAPMPGTASNESSHVEYPRCLFRQRPCGQLRRRRHVLPERPGGYQH